MRPRERRTWPQESPIAFDPREPAYFSEREGGGRPSGAALAPQPEAEPARNREMKGQVAIVTGGATGLGRAITLEFARSGRNVAFNYREMPGRDIGAQALMTETALRA